MILVVGATGRLGGAVTWRLLEQGRQVRVLVRAQSDYGPLQEAGAEVRLGDLKQRDTLDAACRGVETVITTATSASRGGEDTVQTVDLEGNRNLIDAAKAAGVGQFIFVSAQAADPQSPVPLLQAKGQTEVTLQDSGVRYTILVPDGYMEVLLAGLVGMPALMGHPVTIVGGGRRKHSFISDGDVAAFVVAAIGNPAAANERLLLGGPQPLSLRDAVAVYERVLGHQIPIRSVAPGEPVPGLPETAVQLLAGLDSYDSVIDMAGTARTFGVRLTPLEEVVRRATTTAAPAAGGA